MISLRKINSLLVVIVILVLAIHAMLNILGMYGLISYTPDFKITGRRLFYPLVAHVIISLYLYFSDKRKQIKTYSKLIAETTQQILTGISIIVFAGLHIITYMIIPAINQSLSINLIHFIIDNLLFISIALHLRVSIPRFLISIGFLEGKNSYKHFKNKLSIIILLILILFIIAEVIFYIGGNL